MRLLTAIAFVLLSFAPLVLGAPPIEGIVLGRPQGLSGENSVIFVAQDTLREMDSLLPPREASAIRASLEEELKTYTPQRPCGWVKFFDDTVSTTSRPKTWKSIEDKLESGWLVFRARVVEFVPGWHVETSQPTALVRVEILEIFGGSGRSSPRIGDRLSYFQQTGAELAFGDHVLCSYSRKGYRAHIGDDLVIAVPRQGFDEDNSLLLIEPSDLYLVMSEAAIVTWYRPDGAAEKTPLKILREH